MEARLRSSTSHRIDPLGSIARRTLLVGTAIAVCLCVIVLVRGLLGVLRTPDSPGLLLLIGVTVEMLASGFRFAWEWLHPDAARADKLVARFVIPSIGVLCVASAMSMTEADAWTIAGVWLVVAGGELAWWLPELRSLRNQSLRHLTVVALERDEFEGSERDHEESAEELGADVMQQLTRSRNRDGVEVISGVLRAEFAYGERSHNLHIAFCPPLPYEPQVVLHQLDGLPLTISVAQSEIFGARIELRRATPAGRSESAVLCFEVHPRQTIP